VLLSAGLAQVWADAAPRLRGQRSCWLVALLVNTVLFCVLLWSTSLFQVAADGGGWALARNELAFELSPWPMYLTVLALALAVLAPSLLRRGSLTVPACSPPSRRARSRWA
jgi:hypothetical protein